MTPERPADEPARLRLAPAVPVRSRFAPPGPEDADGPPTTTPTPAAGPPAVAPQPSAGGSATLDPSGDAEAAPRRAGAAAAAAARRLCARVGDLARRLPRRLTLRRAPAAPRVARVFDGHRDGIPCFAPERPVIVDRLERDALLTLLRSGSVLVHASRRMRDDLGGVDATVPADLRSDGTWIWSDAVAYYLEHHWIAPDAELVAHLRVARPAAPIDADTWQRLSAAIRPDAWEGTTWPLD